jgi:UDP-N-acetylglucosamine 2-epimerase (non-hydrolysing)
MDNPLLICFGTRPEWLKVKPIINKLTKSSYKLLFTGQHDDLLNDIDFDYRIKITDWKNRLDSIVSDCLLQFPDGSFKGVLVQGDTASAFGCSLAAFHRKIKIYYLEAGLRTYNLQHPFPEEGYRQMISRISDVNFSPTQLSLNNLVQEKVHGLNFITGNSVLDNLVGNNNCSYENKVLITLHRRENHKLIKDWFTAINFLASKHPEIEFTLPLHPNPEVQKHKSILTNVTVIEPMTHEGLINLLVKCKLIITDSGGLQEEGSFFNKKVIVCRETTERPEGITSGHIIMCESPGYLENIFSKLIVNYEINEPCPYGQGNTSDLVNDLINKF